MSFTNPSDSQIRDYLKNSKTIAVVGLSDKEDRPSYQVSKIMQAYGYEIIPVNPAKAGQKILGQTVYARLEDIPQPLDIVNIFRPSSALPDLAKEFIKADAKIFWAQLGIESQEAADLLNAASKRDVVMNRCIKIEYQRLI